ncbi:MAG TPA: PIN domain-containing protein [Pyrinomonadaceae bacterium]
MRTNIVLIDFESVQPESLAALEREHFKVIVFVGASQAKVPIEIATALQRMGSNAEYVKISGHGKNALDFHLCFYIGQLAAQEPAAYFHVISKDGGFDPLIQHLKSKKIFCARSSSIDDIPLVKASNKKSTGERAQMVIEKLRHPRVTRPRAIKTLSSAIAVYFQKQITDAEIKAVIAAMQKSGFISVAGSKVSYTTEG